MSRKAQEQIELIKAVGMVIVSIIIVAGGLLFMYMKPNESGIVGGFVGTVIAYYFLSANQNRTIKKTVNEVLAGDAMASSTQLRTLK